MLGTRSFEKRKYFDGLSVLVTGATGLLGSHIVQTLVDLGARTVTLVRDTPPLSAFYLLGLEKRVTVVRGDVADEALMLRVLTEYEVDLVFHLAAQTIVAHARRNPSESYRVNLMGTSAVLEAARRSDREVRVVVASSDKAYGPSATLPYTEDAPLAPVDPYEASKACADIAARSFARSYGMPVAITRCGNLYGGGDLNWSRLIPGTMRSVIRGTPPIIRSDGSFVRDYLYVKDAVIAYLTLAHALQDRALWGEAFNISNDEPRAVLSVVEEILAIAGKPEVVPIVEGGAKDEIPEQYLSSDKAHRLLGYTARLSLKEGLRETWEWYRSYLGAAD